MCLEFFNETCDSQITLQLYIHVFCNDAFPLRSNFTPVGEITVTQTTTFRQTLMSSFTFPAETVFHKPFCVLRGHFVTIIFSGVTQKLFQTPMIMQSAWFKYYPFWSEWRMAKTTYTKKNNESYPIPFTLLSLDPDTKVFPESARHKTVPLCLKYRRIVDYVTFLLKFDKTIDH